MARALAVVLTTLTFLGCSASAERPLLDRFFDASRLRDLTALNGFSTVVFEPAVDGIVTSYRVTHVTSTASADGQMQVKDVTIAAPVKQDDGGMAWKDFVITMQRSLSGRDGDRWGGWRITAISGRPGSPSPPRS